MCTFGFMQGLLKKALGTKKCVGPDQYNNEGGDGGRSKTDNKR